MLSLTNVVHLWSLQVFPKVQLIDDEFKAFTKCTQDGGTKVVQVKVDKGFITLSMA
jgi:malate/lactate dehydrogenase